MICPKCKEQMPLLSKVCPVCGYVMDGDGEETLSAGQLVEQLEGVLHAVKSLPRPTFGRSMGRFAIVVVPILTVLLIISAWISEAGLFWILAGIFALWSVVLITKRIFGKLGNQQADRRFAELKNDCEYLTRNIRRDFGKNREIAVLLDDVSREFDDVERARRAANVRNVIIWSVLSLLVCVLAARGVLSISAIADEADRLASDWRTLVEKFDVMQDDEYDNTTRLKTVTAIVKAREMAEAENFYRRYCAKKVGDVECAAVILRAYVEDDNREAAAKFIDGMTLHYDSDFGKLRQLIFESE